MSERVEIEKVKLTNEIDIPFVGLGTFRAENAETLTKAIKYAVNIGYRHFDLAWAYNNEDIIGAALKSSIQESNGKLKREDFFLTSKCWNTFHSKDLVRECLNQSLERLGFDYIDLYLIHWPTGFKENTCEAFPKDAEGNRLFSDVHYTETWKGMEELYKEKKVRSIGVSNFNISQLQDILDMCKIRPVNNQVEVNPYFQNDKLVEFCQKNGIIVSAFGPIGAGQKPTDRPDSKVILENDVLIKIAEKYNKSTAQICIRWGIQRGIVMLPKSVTPSRILENAQVFDFNLSEEDMVAIKKINLNSRIYPVEA